MDSASQHARISHASRNALSQALRLGLWKGACVDLEDVCCVGLRKEEGSTLPALSRHVLNHDRGASIAELQHHRLEPLAIPTRGEAEGEDVVSGGESADVSIVALWLSGGGSWLRADLYLHLALVRGHHGR